MHDAYGMAQPATDESRADFMARCVAHTLNCGMAETQTAAEGYCTVTWDNYSPAAEAQMQAQIEQAKSEKKFHRAYSLLNTKSVVDEEQRIIEGVASTPTTDRQGDIVEPLGAQFKLPMPLLWQHDSKSPVGHVIFAEARKDGIPFRAQIAKIDEPGKLKERLDEAWQSLKTKLVGAVSIGFKSLESEDIDEEKSPRKPKRDAKGFWFGPTRFLKWEWLELSLVTIPANSDCTISVVRALDNELLARKGNRDVAPPSVAAKPIVKMTEAKMAKRTIAEQIAGFEATRAAKAARMTEIMDDVGERSETLDQAGQEEYDGLEVDVNAIEGHLVRLRNLEKLNLAKAVPVIASDIRSADVSRNGNGTSRFPIIQMQQKKVEDWVPFVRVVIALARARGNPYSAAEICKENDRWMAETPDLPELCKAAVVAATTTSTTWAGPLVNYQILTSAFAQFLYPLTIIGRIPGLTRVPFKVRVPRQTANSSAGWVGEGKVKPLSQLAFDSITLDFAKIAGIVPLTEEVVRSSDPAIEPLVRNDLAATIIKFMDSQFVDPSKAADDISPASITNGVTPLTPTGTNAAALRSDLTRLQEQFLTNNLSLATAVYIMTQSLAGRIAAMTNTLGQRDFPSVTPTGGDIFGVPVVAAENIPSTTGSPSEGYPLILAKADDILLADDGQVTIDASREATLQMDSTPDSPVTGATTLVSLWQHNMVAIKAERFVNWAKRRSTAVSYISGAVYNTTG